MTAALWFWALWNAVITLGALLALAVYAADTLHQNGAAA